MKRSIIEKPFAVAALATLALCITPAARAENRGCSNASLRGIFAYTSVGSIAAPPTLAGPFAEVGAQVFDGQGNTTATATLSQNGNIIPVTVTGTYTVNPDCTGTFTLQISPLGITNHVSFVISDSENEIRAIETDSGLVITRIYQRQFPATDWRNY